MPPSLGFSAVRRFLRLEAAGGAILALASVAAMIVANSPLQRFYTGFFDLPLMIQFGEFTVARPLLHWIDDGLMAVFFLLVGLEIKREALSGELAAPRRALLPILAAIGGMAMPALVYLIVTLPEPGAARGWAIPSATDIAFSVGVLALVGRKAAPQLRTFLLALAIIDDLGAILVIAIFYAGQLSIPALVLALGAILALAALNLSGVVRLTPYLVAGALLWAFMLESGVHATLAGVVTGLAVPIADRTGGSPLRRLENLLHPWVAFGILPLFAFGNAGIPLDRVTPDTLLDPVTIGVALGLILGKPLGVLLISEAAIRLGIGALPSGVDRSQFRGMAALTGIGFTMSLFIGTLAFADAPHAVAIRLGVVAGSLVSAALGFTLLRRGSGPA